MQGTSAVHGDHFSWVPKYHLTENNKIWDLKKKPIRNKLIGEHQQTTSIFKLKIKCIAKTVKSNSFKSTELRKWKKLLINKDFVKM